MFCEHNAKARKEGCCAKCLELKPFKQFKTCKKQCFNCKECGWFYGPGAEESKIGKPVPEAPKSAPTDFDGVIRPNQKTQLVKMTGLEDNVTVGAGTANRYTADSIRAKLAPHYDIYYQKLSVGQPANWKCDQQVKDNFVLSNWMIDELRGLSAVAEWHGLETDDVDRIDTQHFFNRKARAEEDLYEVAARAMNNYLDKKIERYRRIERS